jgi:hypothetical protein
VDSVEADVTLDGLVLNGRLFRVPKLPSEYTEVLRTPARILEESQPAPYGHRNNQIHMFDDLGLYLIEHHATRLIDAVVFVLWLEECAFAPAREFSGKLTVGGVRFFPGMAPKDNRGGTIEFEGPVLGLWTASKEGVWVGLRGIGARMRSGRRSKKIRFIEVSVCFEGPRK